MQPLLDWLFNELQDPAKAATGFLGSTATFIVLVVFRAVRDERKRREEEEKKVTPIQPTVRAMPEPKRPSGPVEVTLQKWSLEEENADLRTRLATLDLELRRSKAEQARTALALAVERDASEALKRENNRLNGEREGGYTRLPPPQSRTGLTPIKTIVELDDRPIEDKPTPTQGRARVRR